MKILYSLIVLCLAGHFCFAKDSSTLLKQGWEELIKDNDTAALQYFERAYEKALHENNLENSASALLHIGICSYGASYSQGLRYCLSAMDEFKKLEKTAPQKALEGRCKCLQLISTIKGRQGKYRESVALSREAMIGFLAIKDTTDYLGLVCSSLGEAYSHLNQPDSSEFFHRLALKERLVRHQFVYLPGSYISVADIERTRGNKDQSFAYYKLALHIADSTGNRQAQVLSLLGMGKWLLAFERKEEKAIACYYKAAQIATDFTDKYFLLKAFQQLLLMKKQQGNYKEALLLAEKIQGLKDTLAEREKDRITRILEVQFNIAEKDRKLSAVQAEKDLASLTNYLLWGTIGFLILVGAGIILFLKKINRRDRQLLQTKEELVSVIESQKKLQEQHMQNELEFKESQLTAVTLQILQKNELLQELKEKLDQESDFLKENAVRKLINKGLNDDKEWNQFNASFESINKNFYARIKQAYPGISPNDLKICALIKMNLSIKDMAGILNISPDSVKTARYRLRKKLQLNSEDNLTDFILNL